MASTVAAVPVATRCACRRGSADCREIVPATCFRARTRACAALWLRPVSGVRPPLASDGSTEKMGQLLGVGSDRPRPYRHRRGQQLDQIESDADRSVLPFDEVTTREGPFRNQVENEPLDLGSNRFDEIEGQVVPPWLVGMHKAKCGMEPNCLARVPRSQQAST